MLRARRVQITEMHWLTERLSMNTRCSWSLLLFRKSLAHGEHFSFTIDAFSNVQNHFSTLDDKKAIHSIISMSSPPAGAGAVVAAPVLFAFSVWAVPEVPQ